MSAATGFKDAQDAIRKHWKTAWASAQPNVPFSFENTVYTGDPKVDHVEFIVRENNSLAITCGSPGTRRWRILGNVVVLIYCKTDGGAGLAREYADSITTIFRGIRINNISFLAPKVVPIGREQQNYRINVLAPFQFDIIA